MFSLFPLFPLFPFSQSTVRTVCIFMLFEAGQHYLTPGFRETGGQSWPGVRRLPQTCVLARGFYMLCTPDKRKGIRWWFVQYSMHFTFPKEIYGGRHVPDNCIYIQYTGTIFTNSSMWSMVYKNTSIGPLQLLCCAVLCTVLCCAVLCTKKEFAL